MPGIPIELRGSSNRSEKKQQLEEAVRKMTGLGLDSVSIAVRLGIHRKSVARIQKRLRECEPNQQVTK